MYETGAGVISPITQVGAHDKYILFSKDVLETGLDWSQLKVGIQVEMSTVISKNGGLYAEQVRLYQTSNDTKTWIKNSVDYFRSIRYKDHIEMAILLIGMWSMGILVCLAIAWLIDIANLGTSSSYREDRPTKTDYSPYGGWVYE